MGLYNQMEKPRTKWYKNIMWQWHSIERWRTNNRWLGTLWGPHQLTNSFELPKCGRVTLNSSRHNQIIDSLGQITKISYQHLEMHLLQQNEASKWKSLLNLPCNFCYRLLCEWECAGFNWGRLRGSPPELIRSLLEPRVCLNSHWSRSRHGSSTFPPEMHKCSAYEQQTHHNSLLKKGTINQLIIKTRRIKHTPKSK